MYKYLIFPLSSYFIIKHLTKLCCVAAECVKAMAVDTILQMHLLQSGVLWHLFKALFSYDFTLEEAGVEASEDTNQQISTNNYAKQSIEALKSLCGDGNQIPKNDVIRASLDSLIMPHGAKLVIQLIIASIHVSCQFNIPKFSSNSRCSYFRSFIYMTYYTLRDT